MDERLTLLAHLLKNSGDIVLRGEAKLSLQLEEVIFIVNCFDTHGSGDFIDVQLKSANINTIVDFLQKTRALKIVGGSTRSCEIFSLQICRSLKYLELYSVPVEILSDIDFLKLCLKTITLNRACSNVCAFLHSEDSSTVWQCLTRANFCFNNICSIPDPLNITIPYIKQLDLSHNDIRDVGDSLIGLKFLEILKISFNLLEDIPIIDSANFKTLVAKNNNIKMLDGFYQIKNMIDIDLRGNCLEYIEQLSPLAHFSKLEHLFLSGNPISFNSKYRIGVLRELNHTINTDNFYLDSCKVTIGEYDYLRIVTSATVANISQPMMKTLQLPNLPVTNDSKSSTESLIKTPRKVQKVRISSFVDDKIDVSEDIITPDKTNESEIPNSMAERYGDNWLTFFEGRECTTVVVDDNVDLDKLTGILDPTDDIDDDNESLVQKNLMKTCSEEEIDENMQKCDDLEEENDQNNHHNADPHHDKLLEIDEPVVISIANSVIGENIDDFMSDNINDEELDEARIVDKKGTQHFAKLSDEDVFLTVHETLITEQDSIGQVLQTLDISCLENFIENKDNCSIDLHFDHVAALRQHRIYTFNTLDEMYTFLKEIEAIWMTVRDQNVRVNEVQCLNCKNIFPKSDGPYCIECGSELLIPYSPFEVIPTTGQYLNDSGALPYIEAIADDDRDTDVSSSYSTQTTHTDYSLHSSTTMFINQSNFVKADHTLELFFEVQLFMRESEILCCYLFAQYSKYERSNVLDCVLVVSNYMVYICKLKPPQNPSLKSRHRLSQLKFLDIGLNYQHFRLEWATKGASYKFLVYDKEKCKNFIETLTLALPVTTQLNKVSTSTISAIHELVFGIDKTFELFAKGKQYRQIMKNTVEKWGIRDRMLMFKTYEMSFVGCEFVDMLTAEGEYNSRAEAIDLCQQMLVIDVLHHVKFEEQFKDDGTLYRFSADEPGYNIKQEVKIQDNPNKDILCYQLCYLTESTKSNPISLIISNVKLFLTHEYHQWPLPRSQPPLPFCLRGQHFQLLFEIDIVDITMLVKNDKTLAISTQNKCFDLTFSTDLVIEEISKLIAKLWEDTFGFPLQICKQ